MGRLLPKTPEQSPSFHFLSAGEHFLPRHVASSGLRAFFLVCLWTSCSGDEMLCHPPLVCVSPHEARLHCVATSGSQADAVSVAFVCLCRWPLGRRWVIMPCLGLTRDSGSSHPMLMGGRPTSQSPEGVWPGSLFSLTAMVMCQDFLCSLSLV